MTPFPIKADLSKPFRLLTKLRGSTQGKTSNAANVLNISPSNPTIIVNNCIQTAFPRIL